jgi:antitoxin ParD1/3/4
MSMLVEAAAQQRSQMSLNVPPEFERAVLERVQSGHYDSTDEVFAACLHALALWEAEQEAKLEALRREVKIGLDQADRGQVVDGHEAFARARARLLEKAASR